MDREIIIATDLLKSTPHEAERVFLREYISSLRAESEEPHFRHGCAVVAAQEFSRKIVSWNLIHLGKFDLDVHLYPGEYLAGGAVFAKIWEREHVLLLSRLKRTKKEAVRDLAQFNPAVARHRKRVQSGKIDINTRDIFSFMQHKYGAGFCEKYSRAVQRYGEICSCIAGIKPVEINDYDIFCTCYPHTRLAQIARCVETTTSISYEHEGRKIQVIKRIYASPDQIIGGFDVDPCRFIQDADGNIFTTHGGAAALLTGTQIINPNSQSKNFYYRIAKYSQFFPRHIYSYDGNMIPRMFSAKSDYYGEAPQTPVSDLEMNLFYLLRGEFDNCFVRDGRKFSLNEFLAVDLSKKKYSFCGQDLAVTFAPETQRELLRRKITVFYPRYEAVVGHFIRKNPHRQFTSSFHPTNYPLEHVYARPRKIDLLRVFPEILAIFVGLRGARIPKPIVYRVLRDYFDQLTLKI